MAQVLFTLAVEVRSNAFRIGVGVLENNTPCLTHGGSTFGALYHQA